MVQRVVGVVLVLLMMDLRDLVLVDVGLLIYRAYMVNVKLFR